MFALPSSSELIKGKYILSWVINMCKQNLLFSKFTDFIFFSCEERTCCKLSFLVQMYSFYIPCPQMECTVLCHCLFVCLYVWLLLDIYIFNFKKLKYFLLHRLLKGSVRSGLNSFFHLVDFYRSFLPLSVV